MDIRDEFALGLIPRFMKEGLGSTENLREIVTLAYTVAEEMCVVRYGEPIVEGPTPDPTPRCKECGTPLKAMSIDSLEHPGEKAKFCPNENCKIRGKSQ